MKYEPMPYGDPVYFEGEYQEDKLYNLYIQNLTCSFKIKKGKIPTIQIKKNICFKENEYLESSDGEIVLLSLTNVDLKLFFEHYNVDNLEYINGFKFKSKNGFFTNYVDKWTERKIQAKHEGNSGMYQISKIMLNSLYGKFALNPKVSTKEPYLLSDGIVRYTNNDEEEREPIYLPVGSFITSYARNKTIRTSQAIKDYSIEHYGKDLYIYSDTDSIHTLLPIEECKKFCDIDDFELSKWKHESDFTKARFIRQKTYIEEIDDKLKVTCAGMPKMIVEKVTWENFKEGTVFPRCFEISPCKRWHHIKRTAIRDKNGKN